MNKLKTVKNLDYYLGLPYTIVLKRDEAGDVFARIEELQGCITHGTNESEAISNLKSMQKAWIESSLEDGDPIPEPETLEEDMPSGKWVQRVPKTLHLRLSQLAKREKVSLNTLVTALLSEGLSTKLFSQSFVDQLTTSILEGRSLSRRFTNPVKKLAQ